jgi:hypothetical protein
MSRACGLSNGRSAECVRSNGYLGMCFAQMGWRYGLENVDQQVPGNATVHVIVALPAGVILGLQAKFAMGPAHVEQHGPCLCASVIMWPPQHLCDVCMWHLLL